MTDDKIIETIRKVKTLADRGVNGERASALAMFIKLCTKHNIDPRRILDDEPKERTIKVKVKQRQFMGQVIASVLGAVDVYGSRRKKSLLYIECTAMEYALIRETFDFYWDEFERQQAIFYQAFIQKNKLYMKQDSSRSSDEAVRRMTEEDIEMFEMMNGIKYKTMIKRISS